MQHADPMEDIAIKLENVTCHRADKLILSQLSWTVSRGERVCIVGRNGSGKSTLVRLLNGLIPASEGKIWIEGTLLQADTVWEIRKRIGIVFANPDDQFTGLTVEDDIAFGLENLCINREEMVSRVKQTAERLRITHLLNRHPATLSGGQKQRAAIAAVLAMEPSIVVFDEAASMLDERSKHELLDVMQQMQQDGKFTLLSVTHDAEEMAASDRIVVLSECGMVCDGAPREVLFREELLEQCRIRAPYAVRLCQELRRRGAPIGEFIQEQEVLEAIWGLRSRTSHISTQMEEPPG